MPCLDLAQHLGPLALEGLVARADAPELEAQGGVLDRLVRIDVDHLLDLAAQHHRLARPAAEEILVIVQLELEHLGFEDLEILFDRHREHLESPCIGGYLTALEGEIARPRIESGPPWRESACATRCCSIPKPTPCSAGGLLLRDGRIEARLAAGERGPDAARAVALNGSFIAPGFLDLHYHGSLPFHDAAGFDASLRASSEALVRHGTTAFLATTVAWEREALASRVTSLADVVTRADCAGAVADRNPPRRPVAGGERGRGSARRGDPGL